MAGSRLYVQQAVLMIFAGIENHVEVAVGEEDVAADEVVGRPTGVLFYALD